MNEEFLFKSVEPIVASNTVNDDTIHLNVFVDERMKNELEDSLAQLSWETFKSRNGVLHITVSNT